MEELNTLVLKLLDKYKDFRTILSEGFDRPPVYTDGHAANLVRNDIVSIKEKIKCICCNAHTSLPYEYSFETPNELDDDFMANHDRIFEDAKWLSNRIVSLHNAMVEIAPFVSDKKKGRCDFSYLVDIYPNLKTAVEESDFYNMRKLSVCFDHTVEQRCETLVKMYNRTIEYLENNQQEQITLIA